MNVTIVSSKEGDWTALYIDGQLAEQGHSIPLFRALRASGLDVSTGEFAADENGEINVPWSLGDVKFAVIEELARPIHPYDLLGILKDDAITDVIKYDDGTLKIKDTLYRPTVDVPVETEAGRKEAHRNEEHQ